MIISECAYTLYCMKNDTLVSFAHILLNTNEDVRMLVKIK